MPFSGRDKPRSRPEGPRGAASRRRGRSFSESPKTPRKRSARRYPQLRAGPASEGVTRGRTDRVSCRRVGARGEHRHLCAHRRRQLPLGRRRPKGRALVRHGRRSRPEALARRHTGDDVRRSEIGVRHRRRAQPWRSRLRHRTNRDQARRNGSSNRGAPRRRTLSLRRRTDRYVRSLHGERARGGAVDARRAPRRDTHGRSDRPHDRPRSARPTRPRVGGRAAL